MYILLLFFLQSLCSYMRVAFCDVQTAWKKCKNIKICFIVAHFFMNRRKRKVFNFHCCRVIMECCVAYISYIKYIIFLQNHIKTENSTLLSRAVCMSRVVCLLPIYIAFFIFFFKPNKSSVCVCTFLLNLF